jgi:hypothetical protein
MQEMTGFEWSGMFFWEDMSIFAESFCKILRRDNEKEKITRPDEKDSSSVLAC